jgi:hypothetical protein
VSFLEIRHGFPIIIKKSAPFCWYSEMIGDMFYVNLVYKDKNLQYYEVSEGFYQGQPILKDDVDILPY